MSDTTAPIIRVRYLNDADGNIIPLDKDDYEAEQKYHIRIHSELNKALYKPGVLGNGLRVSNKVKDGATLWNMLEIGVGIAIDKTGREIIATTPIEHEIKGFGIDYFIRIKYGEMNPKDEQGKVQEGRWEECPEVFLDAAPLDDNVDGIVLAKITLTVENGSITQVAIDESVRQQAALYPCTIESIINDEVDNIPHSGFNKWEDKKTCALRVSQVTNNPYSDSNKTGLLKSGIRGESNSWDGVQGLSTSHHGSGVAGANKGAGPHTRQLKLTTCC